jgi:hypothetical protein
MVLGAWGLLVRSKPLPSHDYTERPTTSEVTRSHAVPHYHANKSLKTALKNAVKCRRGPDEMIIVEVSKSS